MKTKFFGLTVIAFVVFSASSAGAQRAESTELRLRADTNRVTNGSASASRVLLSVGGTIVGAVAGGFVGYQVLPHDCGCDDPGLDAIVYGSFVGMAFGAALGAAGPNDSVCSFDKRLARSLAGAGLTAFSAYFVAGGRGNGGGILACRSCRSNRWITRCVGPMLEARR